VNQGVTVVPNPGEKFWDAQTGPLLDWFRAKVAAALSRPDAPLLPEDLSFWPRADSVDDDAKAIATHVWGGEDEMMREIEPLIETIQGHYGSGGSPRFRFESRLVLPGRLLRTNGSQDRDGAVWFYRSEDLEAVELAMEAESVTLDDEKLRALGARRELETAQLLQLVDILVRRDPDGALRKLLASAVERGKLGVLRDAKDLPDDLKPLARELADLLDPEVPFPPS
jgi:hypothetical protein